MAKEKHVDTTLPGGVDFDVDNATQEDYDKHFAILKRRADIAALAPATSPSSDPIAVGTPLPRDPSDIHAVNDQGDERYFTEITWAAMETKGEHSGWQVAVAKPTNVQ